MTFLISYSFLFFLFFYLDASRTRRYFFINKSTTNKDWQFLWLHKNASLININCAFFYKRNGSGTHPATAGVFNSSNRPHRRSEKHTSRCMSCKNTRIKATAKCCREEEEPPLGNGRGGHVKRQFCDSISHMMPTVR